VAEKAMQSDKHVFVNTDSLEAAQRIDDKLWTFSPGSFVPHRILDPTGDEAAVEPVQIGAGLIPTSERWDVLINLSGSVPEFFSRYDRVAEVVDGNTERRAQGRTRFRYYRDRGYKIETHNIE